MSEFEYEIPLPKEQKTLLLEIVKKAKKCDILSIAYFVHKPNNPPYALSFIFNTENEINVNLPEDPVPGFEVLGLAKITDKHSIFLTPKIFKWADYESKNKLTKWWARNLSNTKDIVLAISFVLSLALTILQIYQALGTSLEK
jgi:hypothetical protein